MEKVKACPFRRRRHCSFSRAGCDNGVTRVRKLFYPPSFVKVNENRGSFFFYLFILPRFPLSRAAVIEF